MEQYCIYDETAKCHYYTCRNCKIRLEVKYGFEGNKMWNNVKTIVKKFETKNDSDKRHIYEKLTEAEMEILREFFQPYLSNDEAIFQEICNYTLGE